MLAHCFEWPKDHVFWKPDSIIYTDIGLLVPHYLWKGGELQPKTSLLCNGMLSVESPSCNHPTAAVAFYWFFFFLKASIIRLILAVGLFAHFILTLLLCCFNSYTAGLNILIFTVFTVVFRFLVFCSTVTVGHCFILLLWFVHSVWKVLGARISVH